MGQAHACEGCCNPAQILNLMGQHQQLPTEKIFCGKWNDYMGFNHCFDHAGHHNPTELQKGSVLPVKPWCQLAFACVSAGDLWPGQ